MKIVDCFGIGFDGIELDVLEIRLNVLDPVVDWFVIVESTKSFVGNDKELPFSLHKHEGRFKMFLPKIVHVVLDKDFPPYEDSWSYERWQRQCQMFGIHKIPFLTNHDIILTSDLDEIWNPKKIHEIIDACLDREGRCAITERLSYYHLNSIYPKTFKVHTLHSKASTYQELLRLGDTQELRLAHCEKHVGLENNDGGWHFSFLGGIEAIERKIKNFAHVEFATDEVLDLSAMKNRIDANDDILCRGNYYGDAFKFQTVPIDSTFPDYIRSNQDKFSHLIRPILNDEIKIPGLRATVK